MLQIKICLVFALFLSVRLFLDAASGVEKINKMSVHSKKHHRLHYRHNDDDDSIRHGGKGKHKSNKNKTDKKETEEDAEPNEWHAAARVLGICYKKSHSVQDVKSLCQDWMREMHRKGHLTDQHHSDEEKDAKHGTRKGGGRDDEPEEEETEQETEQNVYLYHRPEDCPVRSSYGKQSGGGRTTGREVRRSKTASDTDTDTENDGNSSDSSSSEDEDDGLVRRGGCRHDRRRRDHHHRQHRRHSFSSSSSSRKKQKEEKEEKETERRHGGGDDQEGPMELDDENRAADTLLHNLEHLYPRANGESEVAQELGWSPEEVTAHEKDHKETQNEVRQLLREEKVTDQEGEFVGTFAKAFRDVYSNKISEMFNINKRAASSQPHPDHDVARFREDLNRSESTLSWLAGWAWKALKKVGSWIIAVGKGVVWFVGFIFGQLYNLGVKVATFIAYDPHNAKLVTTVALLLKRRLCKYMSIELFSETEAYRKHKMEEFNSSEALIGEAKELLQGSLAGAANSFIGGKGGQALFKATKSVSQYAASAAVGGIVGIFSGGTLAVPAAALTSAVIGAFVDVAEETTVEVTSMLTTYMDIYGSVKNVWDLIDPRTCLVHPTVRVTALQELPRVQKRMDDLKAKAQELVKKHHLKTDVDLDNALPLNLPSEFDDIKERYDKQKQAYLDYETPTGNLTEIYRALERKLQGTTGLAIVQKIRGVLGYDQEPKNGPENGQAGLEYYPDPDDADYIHECPYGSYINYDGKEICYTEKEFADHVKATRALDERFGWGSRYPARSGGGGGGKRSEAKELCLMLGRLQQKQKQLAKIAPRASQLLFASLQKLSETSRKLNLLND